jgi:glutathione S-transferase
MYELYGVEFSGNSLKIRMMLGFLGLQYKQISPALKPPSEDLLTVNPRGLVPVLVDGDTVVCESNAILVYLSLQMRSEDWYPVSDARRCAKVTEWISYANHEVTDSLLWVRISNRFSWDIPVTYEVALERSRNVLSYLDAYLQKQHEGGHQWLVDGPHPTIADVAVFPYVALAEGSSANALSLSAYSHVVQFIDSVKQIPNMPPLPAW